MVLLLTTTRMACRMVRLLYRRSAFPTLRGKMVWGLGFRGLGFRESFELTGACGLGCQVVVLVPAIFAMEERVPIAVPKQSPNHNPKFLSFASIHHQKALGSGMPQALNPKP